MKLFEENNIPGNKGMKFFCQKNPYNPFKKKD